jgi:hypothetical protein
MYISGLSQASKETSWVGYYTSLGFDVCLFNYRGTYIELNMYIYEYMYMYTCMYIYVYLYIYIYIYVNVVNVITNT